MTPPRKLAVHADAAGEGDAPDAVAAACLEQVVGTENVAAVDGLPLVAPGQAADVGDGIDAAGRLEEGVEIAQVADHGVVELGHGPAVVAAHLVPVPQAAGNGAADLAGGAGYENAHCRGLLSILLHPVRIPGRTRGAHPFGFSRSRRGTALQPSLKGPAGTSSPGRGRPK